jgi:hypothetical protein
VGGGLGWFDYDRNGWLDLIATGGGRFPGKEAIVGLPAALFRTGDGQDFQEVGSSAQLTDETLYSHGVAIGDCDHDGFPDVLVTGYGRMQLWRNMGDGTFQEEATQANLTDDRWSTSAGWADLNGDNNLDLYVVHYTDWSFANHPYCPSGTPSVREICAPREFSPLPDVVYYSLGDGTFVEANATAGLRTDGKGLGVLLCDVEPDGDVDIYVANDTTDNFLYLNNGRGQFEEAGIASGVAVDAQGIPNGSMGVDLCDFNEDQLPDLWVANYEQESFALYRNEGRGNFLHVSQRLGITDLGGLFVGFGTACDDFDADGDTDIVVANGHVIKFPVASPRRQLPLLLQYGGWRFQRARFAAGSYFEEAHEGRGLAVADYDRDGDLDVAVSHLNEPLALLANQFHSMNRWLSLALVGTRSNRDAVGALVELTTDAGVRSRQVTGGGSYLSHSARAVHFTLPDASEPQSLAVHWPSGTVQRIDAAGLFGEVTLIEPLVDSESPARLFPRQVQR